MQQRLEAHMIAPIQKLMHLDLKLDIIASEFSAGYGRADLVGATLSPQACQIRSENGLYFPFDRFYYIELILALRSGIRRSMAYILRKVSYAESTLRNKVIPHLVRHGLLARFPDNYYQLIKPLTNPTHDIVAIEAKQAHWRRAIVQARRYTFFANQSYIAVWSEVVPKVDRALLYQTRLGLISVKKDKAQVVVEAPRRNPRSLAMHIYCSEYLYGLTEPQALLSA